LRVALIADDLTGAMDAAAPFARRGARTRVLPRPGTFDIGRDGGYDVVAINTESRHLSAPDAAVATLEAVRSLSASDPDVVFKKIDSTLRGQVATEIHAAIRSGVRERACIAPAVPAQDRIVRGGGVIVRGVPLADSEIARDARMPAPSEPLQVLLAQAPEPIRSVILARDTALTVPPVDIEAVVADCENDADFDRLTADAAALRQWLWVGAAGLGNALAARLWPAATGSAASPPSRARCVLFVIGSRTQRSTAQVARLQACGRAHVIPAPSGHVDMAAAIAACGCDAGGAVVMCATPGAESRSADAVARDLGLSAARLIAGKDVDAVFVTGGDTASALLRAVAVDAVDLAGEFQPGIAVASLAAGNRRVPLVTKSGGFGADDVLIQVLDYFSGVPQ
jgi:D-threonate/D-erythronate kinase